MKYKNTFKGKFLSRPNRFIAKVDIAGEEKTVHVKNTGRCKELLIPGVTVILEKSDNPNRKTAYDLIAVYKEGFGIINMDSQAPNKVVLEWLKLQKCCYIKPEYTYGDSRLDFYFKINNDEIGILPKGETLMEVKGCTLEIDGIGYFPDAPTIRGIKHLRELIKAKKKGYNGILAFVIQMENVKEVRPNVNTHPEFGEALDEAKKAGIKILYLLCKVKEDELTVSETVFEA